MKKPRHFLLVFTSLIVAFVLVFAVACDGCGKGCGCNSTPDPVLSSIGLDYSKSKTEYLVGDDYSSSGLEIEANFDNGDTQSVNRGAAGVTIDSSAYDKYSVGKYEIKVTYTLNEVSKEASYFVYVNTVAISLDASAAKTQFIVNDEDFSTSGLKVYRTLTTFEGEKKEELAAGDYTVLQGGFDKTKTGTYTVTIEYNYLLHPFREEYEVKVTDARQGIEVAFKEDKAANETIVLAGTKDAVDTADLSEFASWITARKADKFGNVPADAAALDLTAEGTTVKLYEGTTEITDASALSSGVYTIQVETKDKDAAGNDCTLCGFVNVWVVDNLKSLTFKDTAENTKTTQVEGDDIISETWQFVATYESGREETVTTANKNIVIENLSTKKVTEEAGSVATVSFTSVNSKLEETTKTAEVTYHITQKSESGNKQPTTSTISFNDLVKGDYTTDISGIGNLTIGGEALSSADVSFAHTRDKMTVKEGSGTIAGTEYSYTKYLNTGGASRTVRRSIKVELEEDYTYTVTVYANGNGTADTRHVSIYQGTSTSDMTEANGATIGAGLAATDISASTFENITSAAGALYIGGDASINIYYIVITKTPNSSSSQTTTSSIMFNDLVKGDYTTDISGIGSLTIGGEALTSASVSFAHTKDKMTVKEGSGTIAGTEYSYTKYLNTAGASRTIRRSIKVELEAGYTYTVIVYANGNGTADTRHVSIYQGTSEKDMTEANGATIGTGLAATDISASTFENITSAAGALYIGGDANINIYCIVITKTAAN